MSSTSNKHSALISDVSVEVGTDSTLDKKILEAGKQGSSATEVAEEINDLATSRNFNSENSVIHKADSISGGAEEGLDKILKNRVSIDDDKMITAIQEAEDKGVINELSSNVAEDSKSGNSDIINSKSQDEKSNSR